MLRWLQLMCATHTHRINTPTHKYLRPQSSLILTPPFYTHTLVESCSTLGSQDGLREILSPFHTSACPPPTQWHPVCWRGELRPPWLSWIILHIRALTLATTTGLLSASTSTHIHTQSHTHIQNAIIMLTSEEEAGQQTGSSGIRIRKCNM